VGRKYVSDDGEHLVEVVDMKIVHAHSDNAATATAILALPTKDSPVRAVRPVPARVAPQLSADVPDFVRALVGTVKEGEPEPERPLTEDEIHLWCECLEDWNPLYWDKDHAQASRHGGLVAPPGGLFHGAASSVNAGLGYMKPGTEIPKPVRDGLTGFALLQALRKDMIAGKTPFSVPGFPEVAVTVARSEYYRPLHVGDHTRTTQEIVDCSGLKKTKLGEGHFLTWVRSVYNQRDELVRTFTLTGFYYHA
jgi:acyl dehydratase